MSLTSGTTMLSRDIQNIMSNIGTSGYYSQKEILAAGNSAGSYAYMVAETFNSAGGDNSTINAGSTTATFHGGSKAYISSNFLSLSSNWTLASGGLNWNTLSASNQNVNWSAANQGGNANASSSGTGLPALSGLWFAKIIGANFDLWASVNGDSSHGEVTLGGYGINQTISNGAPAHLTQNSDLTFRQIAGGSQYDIYWGAGLSGNLTLTNNRIFIYSNGNWPNSPGIAAGSAWVTGSILYSSGGETQVVTNNLLTAPSNIKGVWVNANVDGIVSGTRSIGSAVTFDVSINAGSNFYWQTQQLGTFVDTSDATGSVLRLKLRLAGSPYYEVILNDYTAMAFT